jgi:hypothetical protein
MRLDDLEQRLKLLPPDFVKHDMQPGFEAMADWIRTLGQEDRQAVIQALPEWFTDRHRWHSRAALEIALLLDEPFLLEQAVAAADRLGVSDITAPFEYPDWLAFQLNLIRVLADWRGPLPTLGTRYLEQLREQAFEASSYSRRLLSIRAWISVCHRQGSLECLKGPIELVRRWRDERLRKSALTLIHAYYCRNSADTGSLKAILTPEEWAIACPDS